MSVLGIDVAKNAGFAVIDTVCNDLVYCNSLNIYENNPESLYKVLKRLVEEYAITKVYCEVAEYSLNNIAHFLYGEIKAIMFTIDSSIEVCRFAANEWYKNIGKLTDKREIRKEVSIRNAKVMYAEELTCVNLNDDMADAINIAYYGRYCRTSEQAHKETLEKRYAHKKEMAKKATLRKRKDYWQNKLREAKQNGTLKDVKYCLDKINQWKEVTK